MALLAIDDTDTRESGCTTELAWRLAARLRAELPGLQVLRPALVRLNPAAPHRTRGNGAVAFEVRMPDHADTEGRARAEANLIEQMADVVGQLLPPAGADGIDPQPAALWLPAAPAARLYEAAVARTVTLEQAWDAAPAGCVRLHGDAPRRGEVGALAAASWVGQRDRLPHGRVTYECLVYRDGDHEAPMRRFDGPALEHSLRRIHGGFDHFVASGTATATSTSATFNTPITTTMHGADGAPAAGSQGAMMMDASPPKRLRVIPRTPCPVIAGVRGHDETALRRWLADEAPGLLLEMIGGWVVASNQASADHARFAWRPSGRSQRPEVTTAQDVWPAATVASTRVTVAATPEVGRGGHVQVRAETADGQAVVLWAFEPTKRLRHVVSALRPDDRATILGRTSYATDIGADDGSRAVVDLALEGLLVEHLTAQGAGRPNPTCRSCGRAMSSQGRGAGFRCTRCNERVTAEAAHVNVVERADGGTVAAGTWYQVDDEARGHLLPPREAKSVMWSALGLTE